MAFASHHAPLHVINIVVHVLFGSTALLLGIAALLAPKGGALHRRSGTLFLYSLGVVLITAAIGLLLFNFSAFLAIVTLLSFYDAFSGMRAIRLRGARPEAVDRAVSLIAFCSPMVFIGLIRVLNLPWAPILTYSILGGLLAMSCYDLARNVLSERWLRKVWVQEHLVKMICAYIAISSAFTGTVFPSYLPWSAVVPSVGGLATISVFLLSGPRRWKRTGPVPPAGREPLRSE